MDSSKTEQNQSEIDIKHIIENISDKEILKDNLSFFAFYIALYENFADMVEERIKGFFCNENKQRKDGTYKYIYSQKYKDAIVEKRVDEKENKDILKASMLWLKDQGAINDEDYSFFLQAKELRNMFAHQLIDVIFRGATEQEFRIFIDLFALYKKIDQWWINEIEIPCMGEYLPGSYDENDVGSVVSYLYETMIEVLYLGKSEEIKNIIRKYTKND